MIKKDSEKKSTAAQITERLKEIYPEAVCALEYGNDPWRLLVMARLSAQCTDARVNIVSRELFRRFPDAASMADGDINEIEELIRSCGLFRTKAESIKAASAMICGEFGGKVPDNMDDLLKLPGVGRKIANLMLGDIYGKPGIVADTHCIRICGRFGMYDTKLKDPAKVEAIMSTIIEPKEQSAFCHRIVQFGRDTCSARSPKCSDCPLSDLCETGRKALTPDKNKKR